MKRKKYILDIEHPCDQRWDAMPESGSGKFCRQCSRSLIDFTQLTDVQIIRLLEKPSDLICGRIRQDQLNRVLIDPHAPSRGWLHRILAALVLFAGGRLQAKDPTPEPLQVMPSRSADYHLPAIPLPIVKDTSKYIVEGKVLDSETKEGIPGVALYVEPSKYGPLGTISDYYGHFKLNLPELIPDDTIVIAVEYLGYNNHKIEIRTDEFPKKDVEVLLTQNNLFSMDLIGVIVNRSKKEKRQYKREQRRVMREEKEIYKNE